MDLVQVQQSVQPLVIQKSLVDVLSHDRDSRLMPLEKHQPFCFEGAYYSTEAAQNGFFLLKNEL